MCGSTENCQMLCPGARPQYSLIVDKDVNKPNKQAERWRIFLKKQMVLKDGELWWKQMVFKDGEFWWKQQRWRTLVETNDIQRWRILVRTNRFQRWRIFVETKVFKDGEFIVLKQR